MKVCTWMAMLSVMSAVTPAFGQESGSALKDAILKAARLPEATQEARVLGVPESDLRLILGTAREQRLPVGVLTEVILNENEAIREHGPIDNFGAFVQSRLQQGLRGRDLAAAIRAEHAARGIGRGKSLKSASGPGARETDRARGEAGAGEHGKTQGGKPADAGKDPAGAKPGQMSPPQDAGKPAQAGAAGEHAKPDSPGRSGGKKGGS